MVFKGFSEVQSKEMCVRMGGGGGGGEEVYKGSLLEGIVHVYFIELLNQATGLI